MKRLKRIIPLILAAVLLAGSLPLSASAVEEPAFSGFNISSFGSYPMSEVKDASEKGKIAAELAGFDFEKDGTSFGFFSGTGNRADGNMKSGDFNFYKDVTVDGVKYRAVYIREYRPAYSNGKTSSAGSSDYNQFVNGYLAGQTYYFRFEPLRWRIIDVKTGLVICENCIDSRAFNDYTGFIKETGFYTNSADKAANDYETSSVREFLNNDFIDTAFTDTEKKIIKSSDIGFSSPDKAFLVSMDELDRAPGLLTNRSRRCENTDYARALGVNEQIRVWIMRDSAPGSECVYRIGNSGKTGTDSKSDAAFTGIRPAMRVNLSENIYVSEDGFIYEMRSDETALVLGYIGKETERLVVPASLGGAPVTEIADRAFVEHEEVHTLCLPETVKKLGDGISGENIKEVILCCDEEKLEKGSNEFFKSARVASHSIKGVPEVPATCTATGLKAGSVCEFCGLVTLGQEEIPAAGHKWDDGVLTVLSYVTGEGEKTITCTVCKETKTEKIGFMLGDLDDNKEISVDDARIALRIAVRLETADDRQALAGDVDGVNAIDVDDARFILRVAVKLESEDAFPVLAKQNGKAEA